MIDDEDIYYDAFYFTPAYISWRENRSYESVSQDIASGKIPDGPPPFSDGTIPEGLPGLPDRDVAEDFAEAKKLEKADIEKNK